MYTDAEIYTMQKGHSLVFNIQNGYLARAMSDDFQFIWLQQTGFLPNQILVHLNKDRGRIFYTDTDLLPLCDEIYSLARQGWCYESEIRINCLLYDLWGALHLSRIPTYHTTAAHTYIEEHYMEEDLSIQQLASLCHMGRYYFIRCFKRDYGLTPHQCTPHAFRKDFHPHTISSL